MKQVKFKEWTCIIEQGKYSNGRLALTLVDSLDGLPVSTATINLPDKHLPSGHVFIKNYSENSGMAEALTKGGIIMPVKKHTIGYGSQVVEAILIMGNDRPNCSVTGREMTNGWIWGDGDFYTSTEEQTHAKLLKEKHTIVKGESKDSYIVDVLIEDEEIREWRAALDRVNSDIENATTPDLLIVAYGIGYVHYTEWE